MHCHIKFCSLIDLREIKQEEQSSMVLVICIWYDALKAQRPHLSLSLLINLEIKHKTYKTKPNKANNQLI